MGAFDVSVGFSIEDNAFWYYNAGSPEGAIVAPPGSMCSDTTNGDLYVKESGVSNTGWAKATTSSGASSEDSYQNAFMGKSGAGVEFPEYSSSNHVTSDSDGVSGDGDNLEAAIGVLDAEIGAAVTGAEVRTKGPISDQAVNANIEALDEAIGADVTPVTRTNNNILVAGNSVNSNIDLLDAAIGDDVVANSRTNNPIVNSNDIGANLEALDDAIGTDAELTSTNYVTLNTSLMKKISDLDAAVKASFDGLNGKDSVKTSTTAALTGTGLASTAQQITWTATNGPTTIDGVSLSNGDRILVKDETDGAGTLDQEDNGIYIRTGQDQWDRASDADTWAELISAYVWVEEGTANADSGWLCTVDDGGTLGTTDITWILYASAGNIIAGAGLTKVGNTIDVGDADKGVQVNADSLEIDASESAGNGIKANAGNSWEFDVDLATNSGLNFSSTQLILDLDDLAAAAIDVAADSFAFIDADDGTTKKESIADLVAGITGNGLDDTAGVIAVDPGDSGAAKLADVISVEAEGVSVKVDEVTVQENGSNQLEVVGYWRASASGIAASTITADAVAVATYADVWWMVTIISDTTPTKRESVLIHALNDGTTNVDKTIYAKNRLGGGLTGGGFDVDVSAGDMRLRVTSGETFSWRATRIVH